MQGKNNSYFIEEVSNKQKLIYLISTLSILFIIIVLALLFFTIWFVAMNDIPAIKFIVDLVKEDILKFSLTGLFFSHLIGGLFFIPSPDEIIFYYGMIRGNNIWLAFFAAISGYMVAQLLNYWMGAKLSGPILGFVSKGKLYKTRRLVNKYGAFGIFVFNLIPSPAPLLTFGLALTRYNFKRLFLWTFIGKCLKYLIIIAFYLLT